MSIQLNISTTQYKVPKSTKKYREVPESTEKYQKVPKSTKKYREVPKKYREVPKKYREVPKKYREVPKSPEIRSFPLGFSALFWMIFIICMSQCIIYSLLLKVDQ